MKLACRLFLMLLCSISFCSSQTTFRKTLGSGRPSDFAVTADHGFVITGYQGTNVMLMKTDSVGNVQFVQTYGTVTGMTPGNTGEDILTLPDGGFVIAGHWAPSVADENAWIIRTDAMGNILWDKKIPNPFNINDTHFAEKIKRTSIGEYIVLGYIVGSTSHGMADLALTKLDSTGQVEWLKVYDYGFDETPRDLQITDDQYLILGDRDDHASNLNYFLIRTDTSGVIIDSTLFGGMTDFCYGTSLFLLNDSTYYISGGEANPPVQNFIWHKLDDANDTLLINTINNPQYSFGAGSILKNSTNSFTVCGDEVISAGSLVNSLIINVDSNGSENWRRYFMDSTYQLLYNSSLTPDGGMAFIGVISGAHPSDNVYLVKTDAMGVVTSINENLDAYAGLLIQRLNDKIIFKTDNKTDFTINLYDLNGQRVLNESSQNGEFSLEEDYKFKKGIYLFTCVNIKNNISLSGKIYLSNY